MLGSLQDSVQPTIYRQYLTVYINMGQITASGQIELIRNHTGTVTLVFCLLNILLRARGVVRAFTLLDYLPQWEQVNESLEYKTLTGFVFCGHAKVSAFPGCPY